ncbi:MAG TPA: DUF3108 domain-containing protein [Burkholderiales bacterium]|nr:DUF3108 domain-containing protein [Burkholderiales bacterium]
MTTGNSARLLVAAFVSLALHAVMLSGVWLRLPEPTFVPPPLEVHLSRLEPAPPPPAMKPAPRPKVIPRRRSPPRRKVANAPSVAVAPSPDAPELPEAADEAAAALEPEPVAPIAEASPAPPPEPAPVKTLPKKGRIAYTMYFGADRFTVGKTVQSWEINSEGYKLGSVSETTGIVELFGAQRHIYLSEGRLTARGLQPEKFFMSRTRRGRTEAAQARFDWEAGTLRLGKVRDQHSAALPPAAQDIVSFMYQLGLSPPAPGRIRLPVTNGSSFQIYDLDVLDEEKIETPLGILKTLPVKQVPLPGDESIELWLAVEYRYLPVKLRFFDREGNPTGEQVVNEIRISDE